MRRAAPWLGTETATQHTHWRHRFPHPLAILTDCCLGKSRPSSLPSAKLMQGTRGAMCLGPGTESFSPLLWGLVGWSFTGLGVGA